MNLRRPRRTWLLSFTLALAGCGGGGTSGGGGAPVVAAPAANPTAPVTTPTPVNYNTAEFRANYGLAEIHAISAYSAGATGQGVTVGIVDTGIDLANADLASHISSASRRFQSGAISGALPDVQPDSGGGHGTAVAGVIGAIKNDSGTHGVAFNSTLLALRADSGCAPDCSFYESDMAAAINYAVAGGAKVINVSLGGDSPASTALRNAVQNAVNAGVVVVASAGNNDTTGGAPDPSASWQFATAASFHGQVMIVGAVDAAQAITDYSNRAGVAQSIYVVAPGGTAQAPIASTTVGGGLTGWVGTSMAAPHVSGAVALLWQAFPNLTGAQIAQILYTSSTDLGAAGTDSLYGHGLINLAAAFQPQGTAGIPVGSSVAGNQVSLSATQASMGAAFGDALAQSQSLKRVMFLDGYQRSYRADLTAGITRPRSYPLENLVRSSLYARSADLAGGALHIRFIDESAREFRDDDRSWTRNGLESSRPRLSSPSFEFTQSVSPRVTASLGYGVDFGQRMAFGTAFAQTDLFQAPGAFSLPWLSLAQTGGHAAISTMLDRDTVLTTGLAAGSENAALPGSGRTRTRAMAATLDRRLAAGVTIGLQLGSLSEQGGVLGGQGAGGFAALTGAQTRFAGLTAQWTVGGWTVLGQASFGWTRVTGDGGLLLRDFSAVTSDAYSLGLYRDGVFAADDRIGFAVAQPLRVTGGSAVLDVPTNRDYVTGAVGHGVSTIDLRPSGREMDLETSYQWMRRDGQSWRATLLYQSEPGNVRNAGNAVALALRYAVKL